VTLIVQLMSAVGDHSLSQLEKTPRPSGRPPDPPSRAGQVFDRAKEGPTPVPGENASRPDREPARDLLRAVRLLPPREEARRIVAGTPASRDRRFPRARHDRLRETQVFVVGHDEREPVREYRRGRPRTNVYDGRTAETCPGPWGEICARVTRRARDRAVADPETARERSRERTGELRVVWLAHLCATSGTVEDVGTACRASFRARSSLGARRLRSVARGSEIEIASAALEVPWSRMAASRGVAFRSFQRLPLKTVRVVVTSPSLRLGIHEDRNQTPKQKKGLLPLDAGNAKSGTVTQVLPPMWRQASSSRRTRSP